ncbi:MAG: oxidoreductase [Myxococcota bacterium]
MPDLAPAEPTRAHTSAPTPAPSAPPWSPTSLGDQAGRTFLVTGANSGLGLAATRAFARHGAHVILAVRDPGRGEAARAEILAEVPDARLEVRPLDLANLASVRALASALRSEGRDIDVLLNNAGLAVAPLALTAEGVELQFGANHLGHFVLTALLFDRLRRDARIITVSSDFARRAGALDLDNLDGAKGFSAGRSYARSKLANLIFGLELDRRLRAAGSPIKSVVVHPGFAATPGVTKVPGVLRLVMHAMSGLFAEPVDVGARSLLFGATAPGVESGQLIGPGARRTRIPTVETPTAHALDLDAGRRLWEVSERLSGVELRP